MGSVVKKVAPIAAIGMGGAGLMGYGPLAGIGGGLTANIHTGIAGIAAGGGLSLGTALQAGGLLSNVASSIQSSKYASRQNAYQRQQTDMQNKADQARNRYNQLLQKRSRLTQIRQARIRQGEVEAATGSSGLGIQGTSSAIGAVGVTGTQASANLGNINVAQDVGNQITSLNTSAANYGSQANTMASRGTMWSNVGTLGGTLLESGKGIANIFGKD